MCLEREREGKGEREGGREGGRETETETERGEVQRRMGRRRLMEGAPAGRGQERQEASI